MSDSKRFVFAAIIQLCQFKRVLYVVLCTDGNKEIQLFGNLNLKSSESHFCQSPFVSRAGTEHMGFHLSVLRHFDTLQS